MKYAIEQMKDVGYVVSIHVGGGAYKAVKFFDSLEDAVKYVRDNDADEYYVENEVGMVDVWMKLSAYGNTYVCVC